MKLTIIVCHERKLWNAYHTKVMERQIKEMPDKFDIQCLLRLFGCSESGKCIVTISEIPKRCCECGTITHKKQLMYLYWDGKRRVLHEI